MGFRAFQRSRIAPAAGQGNHPWYLPQPGTLGPIFITLLLLMPPSPAAAPDSFEWEQLPPLPDPVGVAGPFAGVSGNLLVVAGGANFPKKKPWEGGGKIWHDAIYILNKPNGDWRKAGALPRPLAYGVSASHDNAMIRVGGGDAARHYPDVFLLRAHGADLHHKPLPPLPIPLAFMAGAVVSHTLYIAGGTTAPGEKQASNRFFALDLQEPASAWRELEPIPGRARFLSTAAAHEGTFYLLGGVALAPDPAGKMKRVYLREALSYRPSHGWSRLPDLPKPSAAAPSPAPVIDGQIFLLPGDDGSLAGFEPIQDHPGFPKNIFAFEIAPRRWTTAGRMPSPRVTVPVVNWYNHFVIPSGEIRPGVRSPEIWSLLP